MPGIDLPRVRHDTPGVAHVAHFNNAGAALPTRAVLDAMTDHLWLEARVGGYEAAAIRAEALDRFYDVAAALVGGRREQIAFTADQPGKFRYRCSVSCGALPDTAAGLIPALTPTADELAEPIGVRRTGSGAPGFQVDHRSPHQAAPMRTSATMPYGTAVPELRE